MPEMKVYYECDPSKHTTCSKTRCFLNGGPCHCTTNIDFAKQPVVKAKMILPVTHKEATELGLMEASDVRE